jgi:hypothetical protein
LLVEFANVVDAMRCATDWHAPMADHPQSAASRIDFRIEVNLGDIIIDGDIFGDGVNIAARPSRAASVSSGRSSARNRPVGSLAARSRLINRTRPSSSVRLIDFA